MRRLLQYFQQMGAGARATTLVALLVLPSALIYHASQSDEVQVIGLFQGYFCAPDAGGEKSAYVLKSFHIAPLFASRCDNGSIELDSDLDGLCDVDEATYNTSPQDRFSVQQGVSDGVWVRLDAEAQKKAQQMGASCDSADQDADLLTSCEEILLQSKRYEALSDDQTESLYSLASLNINNPDTDADGFIDGVEIRLVNRIAPFVFSNEESGIDEAESLLAHWQDSGKSQFIEVDVQPAKQKTGCFSYQVLGLNTWLPQLQAFQDLASQSDAIKLDFLVYALLSEEQNPAESRYYATKVLSAEFKDSKLIDSPAVDSFQFVEIQQEAP